MGGYVRVSSVGKRDRDTFLSPTLQTDRQRAWCEANGHQLVTVCEDIDVSGGKRDRPGLTDLVEKVERGELDGIVVAALDRFGRSLVDAIALMDRIDQAGGQFVSVKDGFDTRSTYGRLALNILLSIAQFELERHRDQWAEARAKMIEQGRHHGGTAPFGYTRSGGGLLAPSEHAPLVTELFRRRATGESPTALARWLSDEGARTGRDGAPSRGWVLDITRNRVYLGEVRSGDLVRAGAHEPLTDEVTFERARAATGPRPARGETAYALSGLVRCHHCRYVMGAAQAPYSEGVKRAYRCTKRHRSGVCPHPAFALEEQLLPLVEEAFFEALGDLHARAAGDTAKIEQLRTERDSARHALTTFRDDPAIIAALGAAEFAEGLKVRQAAADSADEALAAEIGRRPYGLPDAIELRRVWPEIDLQTRRRMIRAVFDAVVVKAPKVHRSHSEPLASRVRFLAVGTMPADVPRPGRNPTALAPFSDPDGAGVTLA